MRATLTFFALALAGSAPVLATEIIPAPAFKAVELRGGGELSVRPGPVQRLTIVEGSSQFTRAHVDSHGKLRIDTCNERCPQHYRLSIVIETPSVPVLAVSGGGEITASNGFSLQRELTVAVGGGGAIDARAVPVDTVTAAVSGGGKIKVRAARVLTAAVNGGGDIEYFGKPAVTTVIRGGGTIRPGA
jgi:hypothetical protein